MKLKKKKKIISHILLNYFILLFLAIPLSANFSNPAYSGNDLELKLDPEYPLANQTVSAQVELYGLDIKRYEIIWSMDGVVKERGVGQKEFFFQTKNWGENVLLTVQIKTTNNGLIEKSIYVTPTEVDLLWETDTYTPPFYKGKAMNSSNAIINVVAIPNFVNKNGQKIDSEKLIYNWKEDSKVKGKQSGYGKNIFSLEGPQTNRTKKVTVEVESLDGKLKAKKIIFLKTRSLEIVFYKQDPLLGTLYNKALEDKYNLNNEEIKIKASPFFFSLRNEVEYKWTMNNQIIDNYTDEIIFRKPNKQTGLTNIKLKIQNMDSILQFTDSNFLIKFEK
ncbi:MAG: hypothetical protein U9P50_01950 [Patescibacteria group bacterium]|nr:hypothetical protein [Patescibacteria group bacterium]